jgi:hypothetical protein
MFRNTDWQDIEERTGGELGGIRGIIEEAGIYQYSRPTDITEAVYPERIIVNNEGNWEVYTGPGLVTAAGGLLRNDQGVIKQRYDLDTEPAVIYSSLTPAARNVLLQNLYAGGFFSSGAPGNIPDELKAIENALATSNMFGLELQNMVNTRLANMPMTKRTGSGYRRVATSAADLRVVAKQVSQQTLGRELTDAELNQFVQAYQARELAPVGREQIPSPDVAAQQFSQQIAPTEANAYEYLGYMNQLFNSIGVQ